MLCPCNMEMRDLEMLYLCNLEMQDLVKWLMLVVAKCQ